jgi:membrane fusion protein (multidrug efflux system)
VPAYHPRALSSAHGALASAVLLLALSGCGDKGATQGPPPLAVPVIKIAFGPIEVRDEYAAQTEAVDTVEIRARVGGILERQAFTDGAGVKKGDLLFVIDPQPYVAALAQAKAALAQTKANHVNSRQVLERVRPLVADQAISQQDLDAAVAKEAADAAAEEAAQAQVATAVLNLDYTTIRASRDGVISKALIKPGGLVNASTTLLTTLYSVDPMYVNFTISEQKLVELQKQLKLHPADPKGKSAPFRLTLVDGSVYPHDGKLNFIDTAVDARAGTVQLRLSVPNPERELRAGQFVRVIATSAVPLNAARVPQQAVQELQGKRSVLLVGADGKAAYREIVARLRVGNDWAVESGLSDGDVIVAEGINKVRPGMAVTPMPAGTPAGASASAPAEAGKAASEKGKN